MQIQKQRELKITSKKRRPNQTFFCPCCGKERGVATSSKMTTANYIQVFLTGTFFFLLTVYYIKWAAISFYFLAWIVIEFSKRAIFKEELKCPHCNFNALLLKDHLHKLDH